MNKHYNQLGKILLEKTNPQNPAARRDIAAAKERAKKSNRPWKRGGLRRELAADDARVRRGEKPRHTTGPEGQQAMADDPKQRDPHDPPHPSRRRRRKDDWTVYKRIGSILGEEWRPPEKPPKPRTDAQIQADRDETDRLAALNPTVKIISLPKSRKKKPK